MKKIYSLFITSIALSASALAFGPEITTDTTITSATTDNTSSEQISVKSGASLSINDNGILTLSYGASGKYTLILANSSNSSLSISGGGSLICSASGANGSLWMGSKTTTTIAADAGDVKMHKVVVSGGTLILEKENAVRRTNGNAASLMIINGSSVVKSLASQEFASWDVRTNVKFVFGEADNTASNVKLSFLGITSGATSDTTTRVVTLENFDLTDGIYFSDVSIIDSFEDNKLVTYDIASKDTATGEYGKKCTYTFSGISESLKLVTDRELGLNTNGATLMLASAVVNVPEPAEWAAIFGGIALVLAIYRRRK